MSELTPDTDQSLAARMADQLDRQAFAAEVLLAEATDPHDTALCRLVGHCRLREALAASAARIAEDGRALAAEHREQGAQGG